MIASEFNQDAMAQRRKLRVLHEARQNLQEKVKIVGLDNKSGELFLLVPGGQKSEAGRRLAGLASFAGGTFKHPGRDRSGSPDVFAFKVPKLKPVALSQFLRKQLKGLFEETLHETPQGPTKDSWLTTAKVGGLFNVFRVFGDSRDADIERLPRVHTSIQAANKAARTIGEKTGEELRKS